MAKLTKCKVCGNDVSSAARKCPHCGQKLRSSGFVSFLKIVAGAFIGLVVVGVLLGPSENSAGLDRADAAKSASLAASTQPDGPAGDGTQDEQPASIESEPMPAPDLQKRFLVAVETARVEADEASNEMQEGAALAKRTASLCGMLPRGKQVSGWIGTIDSISANSDGKGVLTVTIGDDATASTWNNSFSDIGTNSLIEPGTRLFNSVSAMAEGDVVRFSGEFFTDPEHCVQTQNLAMRYKIRRPSFVFKFSEVVEIQ